MVELRKQFGIGGGGQFDIRELDATRVYLQEAGRLPLDSREILQADVFILIADGIDATLIVVGALRPELDGVLNVLRGSLIWRGVSATRQDNQQKAKQGREKQASLGRVVHDGYPRLPTKSNTYGILPFSTRQSRPVHVFCNARHRRRPAPIPAPHPIPPLPANG